MNFVTLYSAIQNVEFLKDYNCKRPKQFMTICCSPCLSADSQSVTSTLNVVKPLNNKKYNIF